MNQTATLCKRFLAFLRMSPAVLDHPAPDERVATKSSQRIKPSKLSFLTQCSMREMFEAVKHGPFCETPTGWAALFGHFTRSRSSFGRVRAACGAWPTRPAVGRVSG